MILPITITVIIIATLGVPLFNRFYQPPPTCTLTNKTANTQTEALKALADWSKWLISIETALSALLIAILEGKITLTQNNDEFLCGALFAFVLSILAATMLLGAIPPSLESVPIFRQNTKYPDFYAYKCLGVISLRSLAGIEHIQFLLGIGFLLLGFLKN